MHFDSFLSLISIGMLLVFSLIHKMKRSLILQNKRLKLVIHLHNLVQIGHHFLKYKNSTFAPVYFYFHPSFYDALQKFLTFYLFKLPPSQSSDSQLTFIHPFSDYFKIFSFDFFCIIVLTYSVFTSPPKASIAFKFYC